jgi:BASS family bile acid:Na+ symporter
MRSLLARAVPRGPTLLAIGVLLGLAFPALAEFARPWMPAMIFLIVLGTLLRIDTQAVIAAIRRPTLSVFLPAVVMFVCPILAGAAAHFVGLDAELALALALAVAAPPSSGTAAVARMLGLDGAVPLVVTFLSMALAPLAVPLVAGWFGGLRVDPLELALRLAVLIGGAEGVALVLRRRAAPLLASYGQIVDGIVVAALLVFALATMAGIRAQVGAEPRDAIICLALAFGCNIALQIGGAALLPGSLRQRLTVGLILGNRNVGLVWSALGAAASPRMALYFAATQLPIYTLPRLIEALFIRPSEAGPNQRRCKRNAALGRSPNDTAEPHR